VDYTVLPIKAQPAGGTRRAPARATSKPAAPAAPATTASDFQQLFAKSTAASAASLPQSAEPPPDVAHAAPATATTARAPIADGVPAQYDDGIQWFLAGLRRQRAGVVIALIFAWTGIWIALWGGAIGLVLGPLLVFGFFAGTNLGSDFFNLGAGQAVTVIAVVVGVFLGAAGGFLVVLKFFVLDHPIQAVISIASGAVLAVVIIIAIATFERFTLRARGYRRLSRDEARRVAPVVKAAADAMDLPALPRFAMAEMILPNAWTHMRTIVLTTGLLQTLNDVELESILVHELRHWRSGDAVGLHLVWACAWPLAALINIGQLLVGNAPKGIPLGKKAGGDIVRGVLMITGYLMAWPAIVITRFIIVPVTAASQRRCEYEADAAATAIGLASALSSALPKITAYEGGRTGWEQMMASTHPPTELRLEALQAKRDDDEQYQEDELRSTWADISRFLHALWHHSSVKLSGGQ
jgi:Zn-dependent protease with chaperone function